MRWHAVALNSAGRRDNAIDTLKESLTRHPNDRDTLLALISFYRDFGKLVSSDRAHVRRPLLPH